MSGGAEKQQLADGLAFFGALSASISHELNNVISIIDQTAGLVEDMILGEENGVPLSIERLGTAAVTIRNQTGRGLQIIRRFNSFAHSADRPLTQFDINEVIDNLVELTQRLASLRRSRIEFAKNPQLLPATNDPFLLQQMVFRIVQACLTAVQAEDVIQVATIASGKGSNVSVKCPRAVAVDAEDETYLRSLAQRLQAQLKIEAVEGGSSFELTLASGAAPAAGTSS